MQMVVGDKHIPPQAVVHLRRQAQGIVTDKDLELFEKSGNQWSIYSTGDKAGKPALVTLI